MDIRKAASLKCGPQKRYLTVAARNAESADPIVGEDRLLTLSFSSEEPVERWFGDEVLSHAKGAADFDRLNDGAPLLWNHDPDQIIGVVESAKVDGDRGVATVRFARTPEGDQFLAMVNDGVVRNVSFAYQVLAYSATGSPDDDDDETYTATSWRAYEISLVSIPADNSVGVGREANGDAREVPVERPERITPAAAAASTQGAKAMEASSAAAAPAVDVKVVEEQARNAERARVKEITAWGDKLSQQELARQLCDSGKSLEEALVAFREKMPAPKPATQDGGDIGLTDSEKSGFSLVRAINAVVNNDWKAAGFERSVTAALAKKTGRDVRSNSILMPSDMPFMPKGVSPNGQQRAVYQVGTAGQGGNLVATNLLAGSFIEVLRNQAVVGKLGATFLTGLVGKVAIPRRSAAGSTFWVAESGAVTEAEATFDQVTLSPKTVGALSKMSRLMLLQATPDIEMLARADLLAIMALGIDLAAISGSGASNQPTGIVNQAGIGSVVGGTNGANVTFDNIIQLYTALRTANAPQANLGFAINAKTYGYLSTLKSTTGQYLWNPGGGVYGAPADTLRGYPYTVSNQLRATLTKGTSAGICSELVYGNWTELLIGEWGVMEVLVNPYDSTGFTTGDVLVRALQTIDIGVRHGASFAVMSDALTPGF